MAAAICDGLRQPPPVPGGPDFAEDAGGGPSLRSLMIMVDSGPMHIAAALGRRCGLFGRPIRPHRSAGMRPGPAAAAAVRRLQRRCRSRRRAGACGPGRPGRPGRERAGHGAPEELGMRWVQRITMQGCGGRGHGTSRSSLAVSLLWAGPRERRRGMASGSCARARLVFDVTWMGTKAGEATLGPRRSS
jgi:hypothetical protein